MSTTVRWVDPAGVYFYAAEVVQLLGKSFRILLEAYGYLTVERPDPLLSFRILHFLQILISKFLKSALKKAEFR
jgi:hypothetical protein